VPHAKAKTCACGDTTSRWHEYLEALQLFWCSKCGSWRLAFGSEWHLPLWGELRMVPERPSEPPPDEPITRPDIRSRKATLSGLAPVKDVVDDDEKKGSGGA
jgi:hypothetical protein